MPTEPPRAPDQSHAFVVRMRVERPQVVTDQPPASERLMVRIEDVHRRDVSQHDTIDTALVWLRTRMQALIPTSSKPTSAVAPPKAPPPDRP